MLRILVNLINLKQNKNKKKIQKKNQNKKSKMIGKMRINQMIQIQILIKECKLSKTMNYLNHGQYQILKWY